ncbi:hybrid sensor histidine kinase/response regulator [Laspinema olomoucense]|uniref:histidine kinase n=1 Tax=Laspinema olomoucense D3b TaxID=2953688 RepID=A0ABT2NBK2_9CYAN|nr:MULTISPECIES: ATP-binding protein [unclassified Laspinema]MCT7972297.1 ATP-binding protein [Laspinema sp. D3d]MCT7980078.1 ATP-binding protein [Laspinema sp. D3b]MCT7990807.1 ATP-binding protein [Laspinema sp. D3a]MCT7996402.1 ATP-binding protein [Laspinema sp. D3c]
MITVLVVEDEIITAIDIKSSLEDLGYHVPPIASTGQEALAQVEKFQPDIILMDIVLKGEIDGIETANLIRDRHPLPIIFLTAYSDDATLARAGISEPFGYLLKPFDDRELHTTIQMALKRYQAEGKIRQERDLAAQLQREAENLVELNSRYIAMTSHEFRTPMTTIQSSSELLEHYSHKWSEEKKLSHLKRIQSSIKTMTKLLDEVLMIGKADAGKLEFKPIELDVVQFAKQLVEELNLNPDKPRINLRVCGEIDQATLDPKLLVHILTNLLSNALKYSPAGGTVNFTVSGEGERLILSVEDSGIGIPESDLIHLFESFQRASNVGSLPGTGLGLAIAKKCVDRHNGTITVSSTVGVGTTFTVTLPLHSPVASSLPVIESSLP